MPPNSFGHQRITFIGPNLIAFYEAENLEAELTDPEFARMLSDLAKRRVDDTTAEFEDE